MKITSSTARIEGTETIANEYAFMDTVSACMGYAIGVRFYDYHHVVIASKGRDTVLFAFPTPAWEQDLVDEGWTIVQRLTAKEPKP